MVNKVSGENSYMYEQKIKAMVQKELSQQIKTKVQSEYQKTTIVDSFGSTIIIDNTSLQTSQNKIENIIIKERFKDGDDEWIWGVMEKPAPKENSLVIQAYGKNKFIALNNLMQSIKGVQASTKTVLKNSRLTENSSELISSGMVKNKSKLIEVLLEVDSSKAFFFKAKNHLKSQRILETKDNGNVLVQYKVTQEMEVDQLIKSWLPNIKIIAPISLKEKIEGELRAYLEK